MNLYPYGWTTSSKLSYSNTVAEQYFNPNLGGIFRGSFCGEGGDISRLKLVRFTLET